MPREMRAAIPIWLTHPEDIFGGRRPAAEVSVQFQVICILCDEFTNF
jgi:hypothetical protein